MIFCRITGGFRYDFSGSQAAFGMIFQDHLGFPYDFSGSRAVFGMIFRVTVGLL
jgi:hypothetical protein